MVGANRRTPVVGFSHRDPQHFDLFLVDLAQSLAINLTRTPTTDEQDWDWSPQTNRIAYSSAVPGEAHICIQGRRVLCLPRQSGWDRDPQWSPDGARLAFLTHEGELYLYVASTGALNEYAAFNVAVSDYRWSPDSSEIAYAGSTRDTYASSLYILDIQGVRHRKVSERIQGASTPRWSPDGTHLLFSGFVDNERGLFMVNAATGDLRKIADLSELVEPLWFPDGQSLLYLTPQGDRTDWMLYDLKTGTTSLWSQHQDALDSGAAWSSDGSLIGFIASSQRRFTIWVIDLKASITWPLANSGTDFASLRWYG